MVTVRWITGRAKFTHRMFSNQVLGDQWARWGREANNPGYISFTWRFVSEGNSRRLWDRSFPPPVPAPSASTQSWTASAVHPAHNKSSWSWLFCSRPTKDMSSELRRQLNGKQEGEGCALGTLYIKQCLLLKNIERCRVLPPAIHLILQLASLMEVNDDLYFCLSFFILQRDPIFVFQTFQTN
jgi:hypothetical protein